MSEDNVYPIGYPLETITRLMGSAVNADETVALRALLRNASNANVRRAEVAAKQGISPSELALGIEIAVDLQQRMLVVKDDGVGFTEEELHKYFGHIAEIVAQETPRLQRQREPGTDDEYMRLFVIMLLHALPFADDVVIETLSHKPGSTPCRLHYYGGDHYRLDKGEVGTPGTSVRIRLKPEHAHLCDPERVPQLAQLYGDYLQFPIFWQGRQINTMSSPWYQDGAPVADYAAFLRSRRPHMPTPLLVIPLHIQRPEVEIRGVLWVPGRPLALLDEHLGCVDVYWRRMLAVQQQGGLLPRWARFVLGIMDSNVPVERLCSETDDRAGGFYLPTVLEEVLLDAFRQILTEHPERFTAVAQRHDHLLKLAALENDDLFELVADHLLFTTTSGRQTLAEYLSEVTQATGEARIRYQSVPLESAWTVFREHRLPIIDASEGLDEAILEKYVRLNPTVELAGMEETEARFLEDISDAKYQPLVELFSDLAAPMTVHTARFEPSSMAVIVSPARNDPMKPELEQLFLLSQITGAMPAEARSAMQRAVSARSTTTQSRIIHLNVDCPAIKAILHGLHTGRRELAGKAAQMALMQGLVRAGSPTDSARIRELGNALQCSLLGYEDDETPV